MKAKIEDIAYYLPERILTNEELAKNNPEWDLDEILPRTGVITRHVAMEEETALDLGLKASEKLFLQQPEMREKIDGLIFCTVTEDFQMPHNSYILHDKLDLKSDVFTFDIGLACSGFVYSLAIAQGLIQSGIASNILLVTADTFFRLCNKNDRSVIFLFGDGASASWITASDSSKGIIDIKCSAYGKLYNTAYIPGGRYRFPTSEKTTIDVSDKNGNVRTMENYTMDGKQVSAFLNSRIPKQIKQLFIRNQLTTNDINLFVFHQASKIVLDSLERILKIEPEKNYRNIKKVGNTSSSTIPIALKCAMEEKKIITGDKVLISAIGTGLSWGTAILEF